jgi:hypothetical protein
MHACEHAFVRACVRVRGGVGNFVFVFIFHPKNHYRMILNTSKKERFTKKRERKKE